MKFDVFISYSRKDFDEVSSILESLKAAIPGLTYWFDIDGIESGDEFEDKIISAIDNSAYVLFALSENSISSIWTKDEVMYAKNTDKKVIPILLKGAEMKGWFLFKFGRIDCIDSTSSLQMEKLIQNLSSWLGKTGVSEAAVIPEQPTLPPTPLQYEATEAPLCPCGSGKPFKECHGKTDSAVPVKSLRVGDFYDDGEKKGVVFWVDESGRYAKIISLDQAKLQWCTYAEEGNKVVTGAVDEHDGMQNQKVISKITGWQTRYPAFAWCAGRGAGWYLPAAEELAQCVVDKYTMNVVNQTLSQKGGEILKTSFWGTWFWSSTEAKKLNRAKHVISDYQVDFCDKTFYNYVRAVAMVDLGVTKAPEVKVNTPEVPEVKPEKTTQDNRIPGQRKWRIGDYYDVDGKRGVVFWVDETGKHGKIVSMREDCRQWCDKNEYAKRIATGAHDHSDGAYNHDLICRTYAYFGSYPALEWCRDLGEGWYLPAIDELKQLLLKDSVYFPVNASLVQNAGDPLLEKRTDRLYWSSTEADVLIYAMLLNMKDGKVAEYYKHETHHVRAVAAF